MFFRLILIVVGVFVAMNGHDEYKLLDQSSAEPMFIELGDLEAGKQLANIHLQLGHHWKLWDELIYSYRQKDGQSDDDPAIKIDYAFYPLVSDGHPHSLAFDRLAERYASLAEVPEEEWPVLQNFKVLIRTTEFEKVGDLREDARWTDADQLTGLVVNEIRHLDAEEKALLVGSYAKLNLDEVLIIEEGRAPKSLASCLMWMGGGGGLVLLGGFLIVRSTTGRKEEAGEAPPVIKSAEVVG